MLRLRLGASIVRRALASDLHETSAGWLMHKALSHPCQILETGIASMVVVDAEPEAWDAFANWCRIEARVTPASSQVERDAARSALSAGRRVEQELRRLAQHPAYRGVGIAGVSPVVFPARRMCDGDRWWPTIRMAMRSTACDDGELQVAELVPEERRVRGRVFTVWTASTPASAPTARREARRP